jgi:hypothetical protein
MAIAEFTPNPPPGSEPCSPASSPSPTTSMDSRRLTVGYGSSGACGPLPSCISARVPFLRIQGRWLDRAGFEIGANVRVLVTPRR